MSAQHVKHPKKLLVIVAEAVLEKRIVQDAQRLGAHGYTAWDVRGASGMHLPGGGTIRDGNWDNDRCIEIKLVCTPEVADAIAQHVLAEYAHDYGVTLYFADVQVLRSEKF